MESEKVKQLARALRARTIRQLFKAGLLGEGDAIELLRDPLTPGDESTRVDDSALLHVTEDELLSTLGLRVPK